MTLYKNCRFQKYKNYLPHFNIDLKFSIVIDKKNLIFLILIILALKNNTQKSYKKSSKSKPNQSNNPIALYIKSK